MTITTSQKADVAPIGFSLQPLTGDSIRFNLPIRPEDLSYTEPTMQTVTPTLDGAFLDDFGRGVTTVQISGHTGWGQGTRLDGGEQFKKLHETIWLRWHTERSQALAQGQDPSQVQLVFLDVLNDRVYSVAPGLFVLKRNRQSPLLVRYQISMTVLSESVVADQTDPLSVGTGSSPSGVLAGLASLKDGLGKLQSAAANVRGFIDASIVAPVHAFMDTTHAVMSGVTGLVDGVKGVVGAEAAQLAGVGADLALVGRNVFSAYNSVANLPDFLAAEVSAVASNYQNAFCILKNSLRKVDEYPDYSGLYGAFNCSSTIGGAPLSAYTDTNPWQTLAPTIPSVAAVSSEARAQIEVLKRMDPVLGTASISDLGARLGVIAGGVVTTL